MLIEAPGLLCIIYFIDIYKGPKVPTGHTAVGKGPDSWIKKLKKKSVLLKEKSQHKTIGQLVIYHQKQMRQLEFHFSEL